MKKKEVKLYDWLAFFHSIQDKKHSELTIKEETLLAIGTSEFNNDYAIWLEELLAKFIKEKESERSY